MTGVVIGRGIVAAAICGVSDGVVGKSAVGIAVPDGVGLVKNSATGRAEPPPTGVTVAAGTETFWLFSWVSSTVGLTLCGCGGSGWVRSAAWMLAAMLAEITLAMPLSVTMTSVGTIGAPPLPPGRPSSCASSASVAPGGAGCGSEGAAPGAATVTSNPGRVSVCEAPVSPVTVTPLP